MLLSLCTILLNQPARITVAEPLLSAKVQILNYTSGKNDFASLSVQIYSTENLMLRSSFNSNIDFSTYDDLLSLKKHINMTGS